jgi:hypothetical protein
LSVGLKRLLSFARALAADPPVLILDEATSSVDTETEILIRDALHVLMAGRIVRTGGEGLARGDERVEQLRSFADARRVVVLERVSNPTNLGVILRSAAGLGMDAVLLDPTCSDPLYRRTSRVAMGEGYAFPWAWTARLPGGLDVVRDADEVRAGGEAGEELVDPELIAALTEALASAAGDPRPWRDG